MDVNTIFSKNGYSCDLKTIIYHFIGYLAPTETVLNLKYWVAVWFIKHACNQKASSIIRIVPGETFAMICLQKTRFYK